VSCVSMNGRLKHYGQARVAACCRARGRGEDRWFATFAPYPKDESSLLRL